MRYAIDTMFMAAVIGLLSFSPTQVDRNSYGVLVTNKDTIINIVKDTLGIEEVTVQGQALSPEERLKQRQEEYRIIYLHGDNSDIINIGSIPLSDNFSLPLPVLLVNINHLYNHFSASGKQARRFQQILIDDYEKDKIEQI